ncbi:MAG: substrate-binding domain-containing protein [Solirubrobacterales bacterium]|nr:substrate-binding domain-containing protein [Solirubrobacterales bacterium]
MIKISSKRRRAIAVLAISAILALAVAACGSSSSGGSSGASGSGGGSSSGSFMSSAQISQLQAVVNQAEQVPPFTNPGPPFDAKKAAGKKVMAIPTASQLPVCEQIAHDVVSIGQMVGMTGKVFDNSGGPSGWIPGIQQAISQHYNAIVLLCGIDPNLIKPQLQAAKSAGIAVVDSGLFDSTVNHGSVSPLVTSQTNIPNYLSIKQAADYMLLQNKAKPFDIFEIQSNDLPAGIVMDKALRTEVNTYCPKCVIRSTDIPVPNWGQQVQPAVSSALQADPNAKVVFPIFDGEVPPASAAVRASGKDVTLFGDYGGTPAYINQMGAGTLPMGEDVGPTHLWRAYATMDEVLRILSGNQPLSPDKDGDPSRLFTKQNFKDVNGPNGGFGTAFVTGYQKLWGVG